MERMERTPMSVTHAVPHRWRAVTGITYSVLVLFVLGGLALPRLIPAVGTVYVGFALAAFFGGVLVLALANPVAATVERTADGLVATVLGRTRFIAWEGIRGVRDRPVLGRVDLLTADGPPVRLPRHLEGLPVLLTEALRNVAPRVPHQFPASPWTSVASLLGLTAVPASVVLFDGVLMVAWGMAIAGVAGLSYGLRKVVLTPSLIEFRRPLRRRVVPLRAIVAMRLGLSDYGVTVVELLTDEEEVVRVSLPAGRLLLFYAALERELRRMHGSQWQSADDEPAEVDDETLIRAALASFESGAGESDAWRP